MDGRTCPLGLSCPGPAACEPSGRGHHPHPRSRPGVASSLPRAAPRHRPTPPGRARASSVARLSLRAGSRSAPYTPGGSRSGSPAVVWFLNIATALSRLAISLVAWPVHARLSRGNPQPCRRLRRRHGSDPGAVRPHRRGLRRPAGQVPRGADPAPARRHRGGPPLDGRGGRRGHRDGHVPGQPAEARRVGPRRPHARDQPQGRRDRPQGGRRGALRRGLDRPDRPPARVGRPDARAHHVPRALRGLRRAGAGPPRGRRRPADHRDRAGHPRGQGVDLRRPRGVQARRPLRADPGARCRCCRRAARCSSARTSRAR